MLDELRRHNAIVQERIMKSFGYADTEDFIQKGEDEVELIQKGEIDYDWELEKAVYADTAENRKLGRVGQEYHRGRKLTPGSDQTTYALIKKPKEKNSKVEKTEEDKKNEKRKRYTIKDMMENGAGRATDDLITGHKGKTYQNAMKKYGVNSLDDLAEKMDQEGKIEQYTKLYVKMLKEVPASAFSKFHGGYW